MLRNFSEQGIGLWVPSPAPFALAPGTVMSADVVIDQDIFPVRLEIRHSSPGILGLQFTEISPQLSVIFDKMMEPAHYANSLDPHPQSRKEDVEFGHTRLWYTGQNGTELLVWYNDLQRTVMGLQLRWLGKWVFRSQFQQVQTGFLKDDEPATPSGLKVVPSELLVCHKTPDSEVLSQAAQFLTAVPPPLPGAVLWQFLEMGEQVFLPAALFASNRVA